MRSCAALRLARNDPAWYQWEVLSDTQLGWCCLGSIPVLGCITLALWVLGESNRDAGILLGIVSARDAEVFWEKAREAWRLHVFIPHSHYTLEPCRAKELCWRRSVVSSVSTDSHYSYFEKACHMHAQLLQSTWLWLAYSSSSLSQMLVDRSTYDAARVFFDAGDV